MGMMALPWLNVVSPGNLIHGRTVWLVRCMDVPVTVMLWPSRLPVMRIDGLGGGGGDTGVTALEGVEVAPQPAPLSALTVKVYVVLFVKPVTVQVSAEVRHVRPPGDEVTWYVVTG